MNFELYREIWEEKYKDDAERHQDKTVDNEFLSNAYLSDDNVFDEPYADFRVDLARHKLVWTGDFWQDLWFYIKNEHPLLSICLSPQEHPFGRWERLFIELFIFAFACMWAATITEYMITINLDKDNFIGFTAYYGYSILGGLSKTVIGVLLKAVATCSCKQDTNTRERKKWELCGYVCMGIWAIISMGLFALGIFYVIKQSNEQREDTPYWQTWLLSLVISYVSGWIISLVLTVLLVALIYNPCIKYDEKLKWKVSYQDYLNWYDVCGELDRIYDTNSNIDSVRSPQKKGNKQYEQVATKYEM